MRFGAIGKVMLSVLPRIASSASPRIASRRRVGGGGVCGLAMANGIVVAPWVPADSVGR